MELLTLIQRAARGALVIFCIIIIALSSTSLNTWTNIKIYCNENEGDCGDFKPVLSVLSFCAFAGGFGLVATAIEIVLSIAKVGHWGIIIAADALCALFLVAGGAALSAMIKKQHLDEACSLIKEWDHGFGPQDCTPVKADAAFLFLAFISMIVLAGARLMAGRTSSKPAGHAALEL